MPPNRSPRPTPLRFAARLTALALIPFLATPAEAAEVSLDRLYTTLAIEKPTAVRLAPDFALKTPDGRKSIRLSDYRGKVVILYFWASW